MADDDFQCCASGTHEWKGSPMFEQAQVGDTVRLTETITDLDTAWEIPCAGQLHNAGKYGHHPDQFASYEMHNSCCGFRLLLCQSRAEHLKANALVIRCDRCQRDSPIDKWRFELISRTEGAR